VGVGLMVHKEKSAAGSPATLGSAGWAKQDIRLWGALSNGYSA